MLLRASCIDGRDCRWLALFCNGSGGALSFDVLRDSGGDMRPECEELGHPEEYGAPFE